jgi:DNA-binding MarR family transcriptional regulator
LPSSATCGEPISELRRITELTPRASLADDEPDNRERDILELFVRLGVRSLTRGQIAKELNVDQGRLAGTLVSLEKRGWVRLTSTGGGSYIYWTPTDEGREELRRRRPG